MGQIFSAITIPLIAFGIIYFTLFAGGWVAQYSSTQTWLDIVEGFGGPAPTSTAPGVLGTSTVPMAEPVQAMQAFPGKLVYTIETARPQEPYLAHCTGLGGRFNACGTPCESGAAACVAVCAFTCEIN